MKKSQINPIEIIIHKISFYPKERMSVFSNLPNSIKSDVFLRLTPRLKSEIINKLSNQEIIKILETMDPDKATAVVRLLPKKRRTQVINLLDEDLKNSVEILTKFDSKTAAGIMSLDYIQVAESDKISLVAKRCQKHEKQTGRLPTVILMKKNKFIGYLPINKMAFAKPNDMAGKYNTKIPAIKHNMSRHDVVSFFKNHPHNKVVVMDADNDVIGIIYSDDILRIMKERESSSLYSFAGVYQEESVSDPISVKVKFRYKWLIINLATAFLASFIVGLFDGTIAKYVLLAVYMPIVAGMGGNAATQTLAVMVRGITLKQVSLKNFWTCLKNELGSGFINGVINALIVAAIVMIFNHDYKIALVLSFAMIVNLLVAAFFGTITPLIMERLGKDPAASATIFITTATDVLGFLTFLGTATLLLS